MGHIWYAGYGSNLNRERFMCYIEGGTFSLNGRHYSGCRDRTPPEMSETLRIPLGMYFAISAPAWSGGGVAFLESGHSGSEKRDTTMCRIWKITEEQYQCVRDQENRNLYDLELDLGKHRDGNRILTFTSSKKLPLNMPAENYIRTIATGIREAYSISDGAIAEYLHKMPGITGNCTIDELSRIISTQ